MSSPRHSDKKSHPVSLVVGPSVAGMLEISLFHACDTASKRLQNNQQNLHWKQVIFSDAYNKSVFQKTLSLYQGAGKAFFYKVGQRIYRFGGQVYVKDTLSHHYKRDAENVFGKKYAKPMLEAVAGTIIGAGEVVLLPLDAWKIRGQFGTRLEPVTSLKQARLNLRISYSGAGITAARNMPGSFALFGGSALTKESLGIKEHEKPKFHEELLASSVGSSCSVAISNPADVVKTRIQADKGKNSATQIFKQIIKKEGISALAKGIEPKLISTAPKVAFSMTIAKRLIDEIDTHFEKSGFFSSEKMTPAAIGELSDKISKVSKP